ncbi:MAG TPA: hypothetical protein VG722_08275, partial [Tepidisphaeraceae bacterium]|nr:hypothetical protein [Tepidisphaeraceae bacterium]
AQAPRAWVNGNPSILQCNYAEKWFAIFWAKYDLSDGFGADEANTGKAILHFNRTAVGHFVDGFSLGLNAGGSEPAGGG